MSGNTALYYFRNSAAAVVLLGVGGAVAAAQVFSTPAPQGPAVITDQPGSPRSR